MNYLAERAPKIIKDKIIRLMPFAGTLIGLVFGVRSLEQGDVVGGGLAAADIGVDLALKGNLYVAIPLMAYQMARDIYSAYYTGEDDELVTLEKDLEVDPKGTAWRLKLCAEQIAEGIKEKLTIATKNMPDRQGLRNRDNTVKNWSTPANQPQQENLQRKY
jgi:hypothetical protein